MNDTISLLLATAILAVGGIGLYMYKTDEHQTGGEHYNEDNLFASENFNDFSINDNENKIEEDEEYKVRSRNVKTKRRKQTGGTKRRY